MIVNDIKTELLNARKEKNSFKITILSTILGDIIKIGKDKGNRETNDEESISIIKKYLTNIEECKKIVKNTSLDYIFNLNEEKEILGKFLPKQLTNLELSDKISEITNSGERNFGKIMGELKKKYPGLYDCKIASEIIKNIIG